MHAGVIKTLDGGILFPFAGFDLDAYSTKPHLIPTLDRHKILIAQQILEATRFLHEHKYVHQDLKPSNILISLNNQHHPIARISDLQSCTKQGVFLENVPGTALYSAPETDYPTTVLPTLDIWSLGAIFLFLETGSADAINMDLVKPNSLLKPIIQGFLQFTPNHRKSITWALKRIEEPTPQTLPKLTNQTVSLTSNKNTPRPRPLVKLPFTSITKPPKL